MSGAAFWESAWKAVDRQRLADYAAQLDRSDDPIISELKTRTAVRVCDAGCGCGAYAGKLAQRGFAVSGFDLSAEAAALARSGCPSGDFLAADVLDTPYPDGAFDAVVARDVLDHLPRADAVKAVRELLRITRRGGCVLATLDALDADYVSAPHTVNADGDYFFTGGKWAGMLFHPYAAAELALLAQGYALRILDGSGGFTIAIEKG